MRAFDFDRRRSVRVSPSTIWTLLVGGYMAGLLTVVATSRYFGWACR